MRWLDVFRRRRAERDLEDELQFHLEMEALKIRKQGAGPEDARNSARAHFGGLDLAREECRDTRGVGTIVENLIRDLQYGLRMLRKSPVFTTVAILSLAIGIGANTAIFTLIDTVLLRNLPLKDPQNLVLLQWGHRRELDISSGWSTGSRDGAGRHFTNVLSFRVFRHLRENSRTMEGVVGFSPLFQTSIAGNRMAQTTDGLVVSGNYFSDLAIPPAAGRLIQSDDDQEGGAPALVIGYRLWESWFARDPGAIGQTLFVNGLPCRIVGVTPRWFLGLSTTGRSDLMLPIRFRDRLMGARRERADFFFADDFFWIQTVGRRRAGVSDAAIEAETAAAIASNLPDSAWKGRPEAPYVKAEPAARGISNFRTAYRDPLLIVMTVVAITLLLACANLAGLLLARASARGRELTVRLALGAKRGRLVRQLLVEGALLSGAGALAGLAVAYWGLNALLALFNAGRSTPLEASLDGRVLAFTVAISMATTLLFALAPALRATRLDLAHGLKEETAASTGSRFRGSRFGAIRTLVAAQIAVAVPLAAGAILLERTLANLRSTSLGFNARNLVVFDLAPARSGYDEVRGAQLYDRVLDRLRQTPGVAGATLSFQRLLAGWGANGWVKIEGGPKRAEASFNFVGPAFFETYQTPIVAGRGIGERDSTGPAIAVVNEAFVRKYLPNEPPLGRRFRWSSSTDPGRDVEIVGVARDARYQRIRGESPATIYAPYRQMPWGWPEKMTVTARAASVAPVREAIRAIDPALPLMDLKTQEAQIDELLVQDRLFAWLVSLFGGIALALSCVGLYGLVSASVASRTREIGVRMALGADRASVLRMVLGQVGMVAGVGVCVGLVGALAAARVLESQLFGVSTHDPLTLAGAAVLALVVSVAAALPPARRAMRIDPVRALRYE